MALSKGYKQRLVLGWAVAGFVWFYIGSRFIGGAATLFLLAAIASWTLFPLMHFIIARVVANKQNQDPSSDLLITLVYIIIIIVMLLLVTGLFNYV